MKAIPEDVFINYLYKNENFILVKDPKHNDEFFHYTIWSIERLNDILNITQKYMTNLKIFLDNIEQFDYFKNEMKYFTYIPTHNIIHLHIVANNYISYRKLYEIYNYNDIDNIYKNINLIKKVNIEKQNSINLNLKFKIGIIILKNIDNIYQLDKIKEQNDLNYIVVIRRKNENVLIEYLLNNNKLINTHLISENLNNYDKIIIHDILLLV